MFEKTFLLKNKSVSIPNTFGVYLFLNNNKKVIYVGKSKNLKKRVFSYFKSDVIKQKKLVEASFFIDYVVVKNETDALLLENNFIKTHQPKYNILLKDDKGYPWLCLTNERFPRFFITFKKNNPDFFYFGPYVSKKLLNSLYNFIISYYPIRSCKFNLSKENILNKKYKVCLDYHLKKCLGPCESFQSEKNYNQNIESIKNILNGKHSLVVNVLKKKLKKYSSQLFFEKAEVVKNQIISLNKLKNKSIIVSSKKINVDSFYIISIKNYNYINFIRVVEGSVIYLKNYKIKNTGYWDNLFVLNNFLKHVLFNYGFLSKEIISNIETKSFFKKNIFFPRVGYKKHIIDLGYKNLISYINHQDKTDVSDLFLLKKSLSLKKIPVHIECFDISNIQGNYSVASCVVFKNGKPSKKDYRFFNINNSIGINDYLSIEMAVKKRYLNNNRIPDLILIDGGKGQLSSALKALKSINLENIEVISIAKKEEIIYNKNLLEFNLNKRSNALKLLQYIRDEAHRFCLKNHKKKRLKKLIHSELNNIKGLGKISINKLLNEYKSINNLKKISKKNLINLVGKNKGLIIYNYLNN